MKINIAVTGGPCTGKSTLATVLFAELKLGGMDYDLVTEESRKLRDEFGHCRTPFERFYLWRQQEREELRSTAIDGFVTDTALFQFYIGACVHREEERDDLAVRELFRMCLEIRNADRYQLIVIAKDPDELAYKNDTSRTAPKKTAREKHRLTASFLEHFWGDRIIEVWGTSRQRARQVMRRLAKMRAA